MLLLLCCLVGVQQYSQVVWGCWDYYQYTQLVGVMVEREGMAECQVDLVSRDIVMSHSVCMCLVFDSR